MHKKSILGGLIVGVGLTLAVGASPSPQDDGGMDPAMMAEMMAQMEKMGAPGAPHKFIERFVGDWTGEMSMGGGPTSTASQTVKMIHGGRFAQVDYQGEMMGQEFTGFGLLGFDNYKKKFVNVWTDSVSTSIMYTEGMMNQTGDTITFWGTIDEYMTGEHDKPMKMVYRFIDDDTYVFEIHDLAIIPGETKVVSATYRRK